MFRPSIVTSGIFPVRLARSGSRCPSTKLGARKPALAGGHALLDTLNPPGALATYRVNGRPPISTALHAPITLPGAERECCESPPASLPRSRFTKSASRQQPRGCLRGPPYTCRGGGNRQEPRTAIWTLSGDSLLYTLQQSLRSTSYSSGAERSQSHVIGISSPRAACVRRPTSSAPPPTEIAALGNFLGESTTGPQRRERRTVTTQKIPPRDGKIRTRLRSVTREDYAIAAAQARVERYKGRISPRDLRRGCRDASPYRSRSASPGNVLHATGGEQEYG